jgi:hypothetical protein
MRHQIWMKSQTINDKTPAVSPARIKEGKRYAQHLKTIIQTPTKDIIKLFLHKGKPKSIKSTRETPSPKKSGTSNANKLGNKVQLQIRMQRATPPTFCYLISSALRYALLRSNKQYKLGD